MSPAGYVLAGTAGGGVFLSSLPTAVEANFSSDILLEQNYPNPFNATTTIRYHLPTQSHVSLKVFDILGRERAVLVNDIESPGTKTVEFEATQIGTGVYFCKLQTGEHTETKRMTVVR